MIKIKSLTMRNFLSIGNVTQCINFSDAEIFLVIGENLDLGGNDNRNGVGKTAIVNGLSYALFGIPLVKIKLPNLINKTNGKNMMVSVEFEQDGKTYIIERGRGPSKFKFIIDGIDPEDDNDNEAQGENRQTQAEVDRVLGFSHMMFKHIIALNTFTIPFLSETAGTQRELIEQLLGVTQLSEKAELLKKLLKTTKEWITEEEYRIKAVKAANVVIENNIADQLRRSRMWDTKHVETLANALTELQTLEKVDIDAEIKNHELIVEIQKEEDDLATLKREFRLLKQSELTTNGLIAQVKKHLSTVNTNTCHTCNQELDKENHERIHADLQVESESLEEENQKNAGAIIKCQEKIDGTTVRTRPETHYQSISMAYNHKSSIETLEASIQTEQGAENPYDDNIKELQDSGLQEIDYTTMDDLTALKNHQDFLLQLLTSKDSFIRKKIIKQNLSFLNHKLQNYLSKMKLPHTVRFQSDLTVEIQEHGRDLDFDNLSRGERTRLILSLSWAFRDVYESLNDRINLLFIDELIDNGLDTNGVESSMHLLKGMARESGRSVYLISHREELASRVDNIIKVIKESGFTAIETATSVM